MKRIANQILRSLISRSAPAPRTFASIVGVAFVSGCANLSGLDGASNYSCPAPPGVVCKPMSEVYRSQNRSGLSPTTDTATADSSGANAKPGFAGNERATVPAAPFLPGETRPLRSQPKVLRIWVAPYEDTDGDLHEEHRMYLQVDAGRWLIEHHQARIQNAFMPLRTPAAERSKTPGDTTKTEQRAEPKPGDISGFPSKPKPNPQDFFDSLPDTGVTK